MLAAISRCGSRVAFSLITANTTCPGSRYFWPSLREMSLQRGGKMLETRTRLVAAMPASRSASSKLVSRSLCLPTPFVRKIFFATSIDPRESSFTESDSEFFKLTEMGRRVNEFHGRPFRGGRAAGWRQGALPAPAAQGDCFGGPEWHSRRRDGPAPE